MGTKNNPGLHDCYAKAEPDEPIFVLLARDPAAPHAIEQWANDRAAMIFAKQKPESDRPMIAEARECAEAMRAWRKTNRPPA